MPQTPQQATASKRYADGWRAMGELIRGDGSWSGRERNKLFLNNNDGTFADVSYVAGMDFSGDGRGQAAVDYDHDGDLDLILTFRTAPQLRIMRNEVADGRNGSLILALEGAGGNRDAVGARAVLKTNRRNLTRESQSGTGFLSQPSRRIHFGLAAGEVPQSLTVRWPNGEEQTVAAVPGSGLLRVKEGAPGYERLEPKKPAPIEPPRETFRLGEGTWLVAPLPAPLFTAEGLDGKQHRLIDYRGRKVLLNFWSTTCPPCRSEFEDFRDAKDELAALGVDLLAISVDGPEAKETVQRFVSDLNLPFPVLLGNDRMIPTYSTVNRYLFNHRRDMGVPTSFLLDEQSRIIKAYVGAAKASTVLADAKAMKGQALPFPGQWITPPPGRNYLEMATALAERGLSTEALTLFEHAVAEGQGGYELYTNFATVLQEEGYTARAERYYRESLAVNPGQTEAVASLSTLLIQKGRPGEAREMLSEVLPRNPDDAHLLSTMGTAEFQLDHLIEAEKYTRKAVVQDPENAEYRYNLAAVLASMGRRYAAIEEFDNAALLGRKGADVHNNLGSLYMETGQMDKALAEFQKAVQEDPNSYGAHLNLAMYYLTAGQPDQGMSFIKKAQELDPANPRAFLLEAQALIESGRAVEAKPILERLLAGNPNLAAARQMLQRVQ